MTIDSAEPKASRLYILFAFALIAGSIGPICVRFAFTYHIPADVITAFRMLIAAIVFAPYVWAKYHQDICSMQPVSFVLALSAGFLFGIQIFMMATSLEHIGVMINQVLIGTSPIWVALLEVTVLKTKLSRSMWLGILISFIGGLIIALATSGDSAVIEGGNPVLGVALACLSAAGAAIYLIIGRKVRSSVSFLPYIWLVYTGGAVVSLVMILFKHSSLIGYDPRGYFWILILAVSVQIYAHGTFNYIIKYISPTTMSVTGQSVPIMSAIWAMFLFAEFPSIWQIIGSIVIIVGVTVVINSQNRSKKKRL